jgi:8-oxo-dGTP diphosphatase
MGRENYDPTKIYLATDVIVEYNHQDKAGIVLIERGNRPYGLALPGGFAEPGISLSQNARKEVREETGLEVLLEPRPLCERSIPRRDPRLPYIMSVVFIGKAQGVVQAGDDAAAAAPYTIDEVMRMLGKKKFAFDHEEIITEYLKHRGYLP